MKLVFAVRVFPQAETSTEMQPLVNPLSSTCFAKTDIMKYYKIIRGPGIKSLITIRQMAFFAEFTNYQVSKYETEIWPQHYICRTYLHY